MEQESGKKQLSSSTEGGYFHRPPSEHSYEKWREPLRARARARASTERLFRFLLGRAKALCHAEKWHGPVSVSRVRSGNLVFHLPSTKTKADNLFRRMARARKNRRLPLVMADCRTPKGWWRWRSSRDDAVLPVFHPYENATSENSIFHRGIQDVARYDAALGQIAESTRTEITSWNDKNGISMQYYWVTDSVSSSYWCVLMKRQKPWWISIRRLPRLLPFYRRMKNERRLYKKRKEIRDYSSRLDIMSMQLSFNDPSPPLS